MPIVEKYRELFRNCPGRTDVGEHHIPTTGYPVRVPHRRIPAHYREEVGAQINDLPLDGSCSVSHKENRRSTNMCGLQGIKQTNKQTVKDAYPLPLVGEVQDRLSGCTIFSILDLQSGY